MSSLFNNINNLRKDLSIMELTDIKPNYSALADKHDLDPRTVKKYAEGYQGKPSTRLKPSFLDQYQSEIKDKFSLTTAKISSIYHFFLLKYPNIGSYSNFKHYVIKHNFVKPKVSNEPHPRFETDPGHQLQFDWKEDLVLYNKNNEPFEFNVFSAVLGYSRLHIFVYSKYKTRQDVQRCLITVFKQLGGVPKKILTDNMSSIMNTNTKVFYPEFLEFCKNMNTTPKHCKVRKPQTKGKVESQNRFADWLIPYNNDFNTEGDIITIIKNVTIQTNDKPNGTTSVKPILLFDKEKNNLLPLPNKDILDDYSYDLTRIKVPNTFLIRYKGLEYSVPPSYINKVVCLKELNNVLYIYHNNIEIAKHTISVNQKINYQLEHYEEAMRSKGINEDLIEEQAKQNLNRLGALCI